MPFALLELRTALFLKKKKKAPLSGAFEETKKKKGRMRGIERKHKKSRSILKKYKSNRKTNKKRVKKKSFNAPLIKRSCTCYTLTFSCFIKKKKKNDCSLGEKKPFHKTHPTCASPIS